MNVEEKETLSSVLVAHFLIRNSQQHAAKWDARGLGADDAPLNAERMRVLVEEVEELAGALVGNHEHPPELELIQIGGIVINWLRQFEREALERAFQQTWEEHNGRG